MQIFLSILGALLTIACVIGTYVAAWYHQPVIMLILFIPQAITLGYKVAKS